MTSAQIQKDPFRLFFPLGICLLFLGVLIWVPRIWDAENYPVLLHRTLVLNGFTACFVGGFLLTAVPRFSQTENAGPLEVISLFLLIMAGIISGYLEQENFAFLFSGLTGLFLLSFLLRRIRKRKANPPYSFIFLFIGLVLWTLSGIASFNGGGEEWKELHYHGAIMAIILGVGSRLLPGIMGHVEIVNAGKEKFFVPIPFLFLIVAYVASFFLSGWLSLSLPAGVALVTGIFYWKLFRLPVERTALTISLWITAWLIVLSYLLRALWTEGMIHGSHAFFINGIVLLSLLVGTRVIQSHGPRDKTLENWKGLYVVTFLIFLAAATRVTAYLMPDHYLSHLGYGSILLILGVAIWSVKYLRYAVEVP